MATLMKDGRYQARKRLPNGGRLVGYGRTEGEANADLERKVAATMEITLSIGQAETLHDFVKTAWYPRLAHLKPLSRKKYEGIYVNWIRPAIGALPVHKVTAAHLQTLVNRVAADRSPRMAVFVREICSQILKVAVDSDLVARNVASSVKSPPRPRKRERLIDVEAARTLLESVEGTEMSAPVFLALVLGLRRGEVAGLKWADLNRQTGELRIVRQRQAVRPHGVVEVDLKTTGSRRVLRLPKKLIEEIDRRGDLDSEYVCTYRMEPWVPDTIGEKWNTVRPATMGEWTFHDLRHGAAGLLYALGCDLLEIADVLGHNKPDMTLLYTSASSDRRAKAVASMEVLFT